MRPCSWGALGVCALLAMAPGRLPAADSLSVDPVFAADAQHLHDPKPPQLATATLQSAVVLRELGASELQAPEQLDFIREWNQGRSGASAAGGLAAPQQRAFRNGFTRRFAQPVSVNLNPRALLKEHAIPSGQAAAGGSVFETKTGARAWLGAFHVEAARMLRLQVRAALIPAEVRMWVKGDSEHLVGPFGAELVDSDGLLYTPTVEGTRITLIVEQPAAAAAASFEVAGVVEMFALSGQGVPLTRPTSDDDSCLEDIACHDSGSFTFIDQASRAVGLMFFMKSSGSFICSGSLVSDTDTSTTRNYFLTANHCLNSSSSASSADVIWDYVTRSCGGAAPAQSTLPRSSGASLIATDTATDFTLLELNNRPAGRWLLGWNREASAIPRGTLLSRVSHPAGRPQHFSQSLVDTNSAFQCADVPRPRFIYSELVLGGTQGGSSGSPVMLDSGQVVGQLFGGCGENLDNSCDYNNRELDGSLAASWPRLAPFLDPGIAQPADLALNVLDAFNGTYEAGQPLVIESRVSNIGQGASPAYDLAFYASSNTILTSSDVLLGRLSRPGLAGGDELRAKTTVDLPAGLAPGSYYIGGIIEVDDANAANNRLLDGLPIAVVLPAASVGLGITPGLNGTWADPATQGQGLLIEVLPGLERVFAAWFTFDTEPPPDPDAALLGDAGHRWLTAFGPYSGNTASLDIALTRDGLFNDTETPATQQSNYGTLEIEWFDCNSAEARFEIPAIGRAGTMKLQRVTGDSIETCERVTEFFE